MIVRRGRLRFTVPALMLAGAVALAGCVDSDGGSTRPGQADAYVVVLDWLLDRPEAVFGEDCGDDVVFVESIGSDDIPLEVQVDLIDHYADEIELRFIDARAEAVDEATDGKPVRGDCVLIGLGIVPDGVLIEVRGELYQTQHNVLGFQFDLAAGGQRWSMLDEPTPVDAEGLVEEL